MGFFRKSTTWLILGGLVMPLSPALAQTSGRMTLAGSFTYAYEEIQHGRTTFTAGHLEGGAIISSGQGALFQEGESFLASCVVFAEKSADGRNFKVKAPCTLTESKEDGGDVVFLVATREQGDLGDANSGGMGRADLIGGTGKYANITGQCAYETRYLSTSIGVTNYDCTWRSPGTP